jgi:hypothetical protein
MGASKSNSSSSTAGDSGGEDLEPFASSTPTPQNRRGGLFRTPPNTTLAVESTTVTRRRGREKAAAAPVAPVPSELPRMDDRARGASSDVEARQPTYPDSQSNVRRVTMSVKDLMDRMSHFGAKINTKLTESDTFSK